MNKEQRAERRLQYKQSIRPMGVFQIKNRANGKIFVGSSLNLDMAWNKHRFELKMGGHQNKALQADWKLCGEDNFSFEVLDQLEAEEARDDYRDELKVLEDLWMEKLAPYDELGYNKRK